MEEPARIVNSNKVNMNTRRSSITAENVAFGRVLESLKPESDRICYDPYAVRFVSPEYLKFLELLSCEPDKAREIIGQIERLIPGVQNSLRARARYFDDYITKFIDEGLDQLVILGAGYDTRAYRIEGLKKIRVFEVDHPTTQSVKIKTVNEIFGFLPKHIMYVSVDFETENFGQHLIEQGYEKSQKTLFVMEGLVYYLTSKTVDDMLSFVIKNSTKGNAVLFDYYPQSLIDGTCELEVAKNILNSAEKIGEPFQFGIENVGLFLTQRGFSQVCNVTSDDYKNMYFHGKNKDREVCSLLSFAHAVIE